MTKKIESLTDEQWKFVDSERERYLALGSSTEPSDRATAERVLTSFYKRLGRAAPEFVWVGGPREACRVGFQMDPSAGSERAILAARYRGQESLYWVAWFRVAEQLGVEYPRDQSELLKEWEDLCSSTGWFFPFEKHCIMCERPRTIKWDAEGRLHCEDGPAIECRDGFKVYSWHGTRIPGAWIEHKETLDASTALTHQNIEQRRCAAEIIGWEKILASLQPKTIDHDPDPAIGTLLEVDLPDAPKERFLKVRCGTGRTFVIPVGHDADTALDAQALIWQVDKEVIRNLEVRT